MTEPAAVVAVAGELITDMVPAGPDGHFVAAPGGSPGNVAVGLARLGVPTRMLARLAGDPLGRRLQAHLEANGVDLGHAVDASQPSSLAVVALGEGGSAEYDFRVDGTADWQWTPEELDTALDGVACLHLGSIAVTAPPGGAVLRDLARRARSTATVTYDPNVRPLLMGTPEQVLAVVEEMLVTADVVKASDEDVSWLLPGRDVAEVAVEWAGRGPALVVLTRGAQGVVAAGRTCGVVSRGGLRVDVADTVGAGDSFMSALVAGLYDRGLLGAAAREALGSLDPDAVHDLLGEAVAAAALTCSRHGADPPDAEELRAALAAARATTG